MKRFRLASSSLERGIRKRGNRTARYSGGGTRLSRIRMTLCKSVMSYSRCDPSTALIALCASVLASLSVIFSLKLRVTVSIPKHSPFSSPSRTSADKRRSSFETKFRTRAVSGDPDDGWQPCPARVRVMHATNAIACRRVNHRIVHQPLSNVHPVGVQKRTAWRWSRESGSGKSTLHCWGTAANSVAMKRLGRGAVHDGKR